MDFTYEYERIYSMLREKAEVLMGEKSLRAADTGLKTVGMCLELLEKLEKLSQSGMPSTDVWLTSLPKFDQVPVGVLYGLYLDWCGSEGVAYVGKHEFNRRLEAAGLTRFTGRDGDGKNTKMWKWPTRERWLELRECGSAEDGDQ